MADVSGNVVCGGGESICSPQSISNVKIIQTYYDQFYNESFSALIYDGSLDEIDELVKRIQNSKSISVLFVVKEALVEGEFSVKFYQDDNNFLNYTIFNSQNAYDKINGSEMPYMHSPVIHLNHRI